MRIGVIADTHDYMDPLVCEIFKGVECILHAGDVEAMWVIRRLEEIAPVFAVCGNHESEEVKERYQWIETVDLGGTKVCLTHRFLPLHPDSLSWLSPSFRARIDAPNIRVVVHGHSHEPMNRRLGGMLYFNPGYSGSDMLEPIRTVGLLDISDGSIQGEIYALSPPRRDVPEWGAKVWPQD